MAKLHMKTPIWVWLYISSELKQQTNRQDMPPLSVWPQSHTFAFLSEEEALDHAKKNWKKNHGYTLCKTYLQIDLDPVF